MFLLELSIRRRSIILASKPPLRVTTRYAPPSCCFGMGPSENLTGLHEQVYGQPGSDLDYDELVVYDNRAIRPAYLVMYE